MTKQANAKMPKPPADALMISAEQVQELFVENAILRRYAEDVPKNAAAADEIKNLLALGDVITMNATCIARHRPKTEIADALREDECLTALAKVYEAIDRAHRIRPILTAEDFAYINELHGIVRDAIIAGQDGLNGQPPDQGAALREVSEFAYRFGTGAENRRKRRPRIEPRAYVLHRIIELRMQHPGRGRRRPSYHAMLNGISNGLNMVPASELTFEEKDEVKQWIAELRAKYPGRAKMDEYMRGALSKHVTSKSV